jgi:chromate transporter
LPLAAAFFTGIKAAVLAIVIEALLRMARRALRSTTAWWVAAASFVGIFLLSLPFPAIIAAAALLGLVHPFAGAPPPRPFDEGDPPASFVGTVRTILVWLAIWILPLAGLAACFGRGHVLTEIALFFSKLAVVTFGGAYAVLAYMAQDVVQHRAWLSAGEMLDGLGLAETTPGPLILVTEFVGFLAAFRHGGGNPWVMGVLGAGVTLWATFAPCFLWVFAGAPWIERLNAEPRLRSALTAITAAVVGVILNLTVWFALHVLFTAVGTRQLGPLQVPLPDFASLDYLALALAVLACVMLLVLHRGIIPTLAVCGALAISWHLVGSLVIQ